MKNYEGWEDSDSESEEESYPEEFLGPMLIEAAMTNNLGEVNKLLGKNADPNFQNNQGKTALSCAIPPPSKPKKDDNTRAQIRTDPEKIKTNIAIIKTLLESNASPNTIIQDGNTVLHYAAEKHNTKVAKLLLAYKADVNITNIQGKLPSDCVKTYCDPSLVRLLEPEQKLLNLQLIKAVSTKNYKQVEYLLKEKADPNAQGIFGRTPLGLAIINEDKEMVELLITNRANPNFIINIGSMTASECAVKKGYNSIALTLQKHIYKQNTQLTPLLPRLVKQGNIELIEAWIKCGVNVNMNPKILMIAKKNNNTEIINLLKQASKAHKIIQKKDQEVINYLLQIISSKRQESLKRLIEMKEDVNSTDEHDNTVLHYAVIQKDLPKISLLLENKADITRKNKKGETALDIAKVYHNTKIVNLLKQGLNNQLQSAVTQPNLTKVTELIEMGARVNAQSPKGNTVLHYAIFTNNKELVSLLKRNQADITIKNKKGETALDIAKASNNTEILNLLKEALNNQLRSAMTKKNFYKVLKLIEMGADVNSKTEDGNTVLHYAVFTNNKELVSFLKRNQADITIKNNEGHTALDVAKANNNTEALNLLQEELNKLLKLAVTQKNFEKVTELIEMGADVNANTYQGNTALHYALQLGNRMDIVKLLIANKADITIKNNNGHRALDIAKANNNTEALDLLQDALNKLLRLAVTQKNSDKVTELIEMGADVNSKTEDGNTALHYAVLTKDVKMLSLLIQSQADISIKNLKGHTALDIAIKMKYNDIIERLKEEADRLAKEEADRLAKEEADRLAKEEADRLAKEEADRLAKEEADRLAKEEADRLAKEEADRLAKEEADHHLAKEEADLTAIETPTSAPSKSWWSKIWSFLPSLWNTLKQLHEPFNPSKNSVKSEDNTKDKVENIKMTSSVEKETLTLQTDTTTPLPSESWWSMICSFVPSLHFRTSESEISGQLEEDNQGE